MKAPCVPQSNSGPAPLPATGCRPDAKAYRKICIQPFKALPNADELAQYA